MSTQMPSDRELRENLIEVDLQDLIEKIRGGNLTEQADRIARQILKEQNVNIPLSIELQVKKEQAKKDEAFRVEQQKAKKLWKSPLPILTICLSALAFEGLVRCLWKFTMRQSFGFYSILFLFVGAALSNEIVKYYVASEDSLNKKKVFVLCVLCILFFGIWLVANGIAMKISA